MNLINISIGQTDINNHLSTPVPDRMNYSIKPQPMPELYWYRISSLGFGSEADKNGNSANSDNEVTDYSAALFAACSQPFSILCERKEGDIAYAVGCADENLAKRLLKGAFGTVNAEKYSPQFSDDMGLYAHDFEAVRTNEDELNKRDILSSVHASKWVDAVAKILTDHPGMVRLDFHPVSSAECEEFISAAQRLSDRITTYLESNVQVGDNISDASTGNIIKEKLETVKGNIKYTKSGSASVSWKGVSAELSSIKKEAEYFIKLFSDSKKQGWTVEMTVSADMGIGSIDSNELKNRETALTAPISVSINNAGYTCVWDKVKKGLLDKKENRALLLPSSYVTELISFPTTSFLGFERVKNCYYNVNLPSVDEAVPFATLLQYAEDTGVELSLPEKEMNRHTFVCGMTGSGKTNTVHHLLSSLNGVSYLVIEPVKGEYHSLPGVTAYTMTAGSNKALCINPFWFPKGSSLQYHIDCLKQIIASAFDLYAAMPNILEQCLIRVYQKCGWDFIQNENRYTEELPDDMLYPTFRDLCQEVDDYITKSDFSEELKGNYRGALLSRLQSFTSGPKGMLLNTSKHLPCDELCKSKVVISLDALADDADKSIVMGVIIAQYYEYRKLECMGSTKKELQHIVVIEEAHHLFAGDTSQAYSSAEGGSGQNSSQELVKTLNNMLAEIRAYGEGFIIVDQSPSALHSSVLKNTGIKVAHRIDYGQDIRAMQDALLLDDDDKELATLKSGQALVHFGGMRKSAKVQVPVCTTKEESVILEKETISGSSVVCTLLEDDKMSEYVKKEVVDRLIRHLLFDDLENFKEVYARLCWAIKAVMIKYGHSELTDKLMSEDFLAEYIVSLLPARLESFFPFQYCTNKMICMYIKRFLVLATETKGELRRTELYALASYRIHRLEPRILDFYSYSDIPEYKTACDLIGKNPALELICQVTGDLINKKAGTNNLDNQIEDLLLNYYLLCMPKHKETLVANIIGVFLCKARKESVC